MFPAEFALSLTDVARVPSAVWIQVNRLAHAFLPRVRPRSRRRRPAVLAAAVSDRVRLDPGQ